MNTPHRQTGLATLTTVIMLMLGISALSLTIARTTHTEQRMTNKQAAYNRVQYATEAGLEFATAELRRASLHWFRIKPSLEVAAPPHQPPPIRSVSGERFGINIRYERDPLRPKYIRIAVDSQATGAPDVTGLLQQTVRPFSVLTEQAEQAPPLVLNGCVNLTTGSPDLYPRAADRHNAGTALWTTQALNCIRTPLLNLHSGKVGRLQAQTPDLWPTLIAIPRTRFKQLAEEQRRRLPETQRRYWWVRPGDMQHGRWYRNLGTPTAPVVLVFPAKLGCPAFQTGVRIHGFVIIDSACGSHRPWRTLTIYGSLAVNGDLNRLSGFIRLSHIERANGQPDELELPIYEVARVPGSWRDF